MLFKSWHLQPHFRLRIYLNLQSLIGSYESATLKKKYTWQPMSWKWFVQKLCSNYFTSRYLRENVVFFIICQKWSPLSSTEHVHMLSKLLHLNKLKNSRILAIVHKETKLAWNIILSIKKIQLTVIFHKVQSYIRNQSCQPSSRHQIIKANVSKTDRKLRKK